MPRAIADLNDMIGNKYGKLTVTKFLETCYSGRNRDHYYLCDCDCGTSDVRVSRRSLIRGDTKSCGCAHRDDGNRRVEDWTGRKVGRWTVLHRAPTRYSKSGATRSVMWTCQCECGTIKDVGARALKLGTSQSCGCLQKERVSATLTDDLIGKRFGYLVVVSRNGSHCSSKDRKRSFNAVWHCKCDCGNEVDVLGFSLKNGDTTSCGCKKSSKYEEYVAQYLESCGYVLHKDYFREKTFRGLKGLGGQSLRFDFYVKLYTGEQILIECQGEQHYRSAEWFGGEAYFERVKAHDVIKKKYAKDHHIRLVEVHYKDVLYSDIEKKLKDNNVQ